MRTEAKRLAIVVLKFGAERKGNAVERPGNVGKKGPRDNRGRPMETYRASTSTMPLDRRFFIVTWVILVNSEGLIGHFNRAYFFPPLLCPFGPPLLVCEVLTWDTEEGPYARTVVTTTRVWSLPWRRNGRKRAPTASRPPSQGAALRANGRWTKLATSGCPPNSVDQRPGDVATLVSCMLRRIITGMIMTPACSMAWWGQTCRGPRCSMSPRTCPLLGGAVATMRGVEVLLFAELASCSRSAAPTVKRTP